MSNDQLTHTSYLVLGLLAREGPSTPYDLKRYVAATLGHLWSFPHALLYAEPARLVVLGLATENQEKGGRRRRIFTITDAGADLLRAWLERPNREATAIRDPGLLQLFFADMGSSQTQGDIAHEQLATHRARLARYVEEEIRGVEADESSSGSQTLKQWRGHGLRMGVLYERAAVDFWNGVVGDAPAETAAAALANTALDADGALIA